MHSLESVCVFGGFRMIPYILVGNRESVNLAQLNVILNNSISKKLRIEYTACTLKSKLPVASFMAP